MKKREAEGNRCGGNGAINGRRNDPDSCPAPRASPTNGTITAFTFYSKQKKRPPPKLFICRIRGTFGVVSAVYASKSSRRRWRRGEDARAHTSVPGSVSALTKRIAPPIGPFQIPRECQISLQKYLSKSTRVTLSYSRFRRNRW